MTNVLVTGAGGFVARHLVDGLGAPSDGEACISAFERVPKDPHRPLPCAAWYAGDVTKAADVRAAVADSAFRFGTPEQVFHMAAQANVAYSFAHAAQTYEVNVVGTANLLEVLADIAPNAKVLVPSSAHVYKPPTRPGGILDESAPVLPDSHYGVSKVAQEMVGRLFFERGDQPVFLTRAFNHVGPGQALGFALPDFARRLALLERDGGGAMKVGNLEARRDFLDVRDVVQAYLTVIERGEPGIVYNVASGVPWSMGAILDSFLELVTVDVDVVVDPGLVRPVDVPLLVGDASRLRALGWAPQHDLLDTVEQTLEHWRRRVAEEGEGSA